MPRKIQPRAEAFLSAILDAVAALIVVLDRRGRIVRWNRACEKTTGYTFAEVDGLLLWEKLLPPEDVIPVKAVFAELRAGGFPNAFENEWVAKDGSRRVIAWSNTAITDDAGEVLYAIGTGIDVTKERDLARRLRIRDHLASLASVASGITHEINNPLNAAQLQLTLLERRLARLKTPEADTALEAAQAVRQEIHRVSSLAREFLELSRPPAPRPTEVDLAAMVRDVAWLCKPEADACGVALVTEAVASVPARIDLDRIKQALINLVRNAIQAAGRGGRVRLAAGQRGGDVLLEIEDDGPGLPAPYEKIVEPFFTTKADGTGLGLTVTHRIVADHEGTITVDSRPGRTLFTVALPARGARPDPGPARPADDLGP
jgi:PAS domain S-box-containing protein